MFRSARRWLKLSTPVVCVLLGVWSAPAVSASVTHGDSARPELQRRLDAVVAAGAPGVVALVNDGRRAGHGAVWQDARGVADLRTRRPMRADVHFRVGSVTKSFVATVALQLVAEGRLALSDSVEHWLPGVLSYGRNVTVRELLNHTSGVPDYVEVPLTGLYRGVRFRSWSPSELVALVARLPQEFPAGSTWSYSNTNYVLAGMIIERVTGRALGRAIERRILRPLGLRDTYFPVDFPFLPWPSPRGYSLDYDDQGNPIEGPLLDLTVYNPSPAWAAGNIISDQDDLARFYRALFGGRLLEPEQLADMTTGFVVEPGVASYGLGLIIYETDCGRVLGHNGGIPGFLNDLYSSDDGTHQFGLMINAEAAPSAVGEPYFVALEQALSEAFGRPCRFAQASTAMQEAPAMGR
jgi:D-alanyl-D-alanine carboxypeptidase